MLVKKYNATVYRQQQLNLLPKPSTWNSSSAHSSSYSICLTVVDLTSGESILLGPTLSHGLLGGRGDGAARQTAVGGTVGANMAPAIAAGSWTFQDGLMHRQNYSG